MTRALRIVLAAVVVTVASVTPDGRRYVAAQETSSLTSAAIVLRPTDHPRVPRELSQFWMVPDKGRLPTPAQATLAAAVRFENDGNHARALAMLTSPAIRPEGPLAAYAEYYKGVAQLHLGRAAEGRATFRALRAASPTGYLSEMAALREAECDETLNDQASAVGVYQQLAAVKTMAPDEILMKLGKAAQATGDLDRARAAFERLYYDYPLSDYADAADALRNGLPTSSKPLRVKQELARAERLFAAKMYQA